MGKYLMDDALWDAIENYSDTPLTIAEHKHAGLPLYDEKQIRCRLEKLCDPYNREWQMIYLETQLRAMRETNSRRDYIHETVCYLNMFTWRCRLRGSWRAYPDFYNHLEKAGLENAAENFSEAEIHLFALIKLVYAYKLIFAAAAK